MFWLSWLMLFIVAMGIRVYINRGQTWGTPDEKTYSTYAQTWRPGKSYTASVQSFLKATALDIPPTRYGFFFPCAVAQAVTRKPAYDVVTWVAAISGALAAPLAFLITESLPASLMVGLSPLSLILSRRALQDTFAALTILIAVWALSRGDALGFGLSVALALATREAFVLYVPALVLAWGVRTNQWLLGPLVAVVGVGLAIGGYYGLGGRQLVAVFRRLREATEYVRRLQSGMAHRVVVDLILVSPVTTLGAIVACRWAPVWLVVFALSTLVTHACLNPKNARFLLAVDLVCRMLCCWLPGPWPWVLLGASLLVDPRLYQAFKPVRDPVTHSLVVQTGMYQEK